MRTLQHVDIRFTGEGVELAVTYTHAPHSKTAGPGTRTRTIAAAKMARAGLERALEGLDPGQATWGGFATDMQTSTDKVSSIERRR